MRAVSRPISLAVLTLLCALAPASSIATGAVSARQATGAVCLVPGVGRPLGRVWHPDVAAAISYRRSRRGDIAFAVRTPDSFSGYRPDHAEWSASVLKAMLMVAYLDRPSVAGRALSSADTALLHPMITRSDNDAADAVDEIIGASGLRALAARVGMSHFAPAEPIWGESEITARDQTRFFLHIERFIVPRHRAYAMRQLARHRSLPALGHRRGRAQRVEALLQGRLGVRHRADRQPGRASYPRLRPDLDRSPDDARRLPRLWQADPQGDLSPAAAGTAE